MSRPHSCGNAGVPLVCQLFVTCLPLRGHNAEEVEISCSGIADRAGPATRDEYDLPGMHRCGPGTDMHIAASFGDIVQFRRIFQDTGRVQHLAGRSRGQCCSGAAVHQGRCRGERCSAGSEPSMTLLRGQSAIARTIMRGYSLKTDYNSPGNEPHA